jgi:uncharacterized protein (DUF1330 family)
VTVYALAQISIHDRERYDRYAAGFLPVLRQYAGRLLAADEAPRVVQGSWPYDKLILMAFDNRDSFQRWVSSIEYQEISKDRLASTEGVVVVVDGLSPAWRTNAPNSETG